MLRATIYTEEMLFRFYDQKLKKKNLKQSLNTYRGSISRTENIIPTHQYIWTEPSHTSYLPPAYPCNVPKGQSAICMSSWKP